MIDPSETPVTFPTSFGQQRLWILDQVEGAGTAYNVPVLIRVAGRLDSALLGRAVSALIERHEILRTSFVLDGDEVQQRVHENAPVSVHTVDLQVIDPADRERTWRDHALAAVSRPFDLGTIPLIRVTQFVMGDTETVLLVTLHHIVFDGWSESLLVRDLQALYHVEADGRPADLPILPIQYADFAAWQREQTTTVGNDEDLAYWVDALAGAPTKIALPIDRRDHLERRFTGRSASVAIEPAMAVAIRGLARHEQATVFVVLFAVFANVLARFTNQGDVVIGTVAAGRSRAELADLIGFFVNTVLVRFQLDPGQSGRSLIRLARDIVTTAFEHQSCPLERVVEATRTAEGRRMLQVMFTTAQRVGTDRIDAWRTIPFDIGTNTAKFDLSIHAADDGDTIRVFAEYSDALFDAGTIESLLSAYVCGLKGLVSTPEDAIGSWPLLSTRDRHRLIVEWSGHSTPTGRTAARRIEEWFDSVVTNRPEAVAIVCGNGTVTYGGLRQRADAIASQVGRRVTPGSVVGVVADRSIDYVASLIGILKAGATYLPIDPDLPLARVAFMVQDSDVQAIVGRPSVDLDLGPGIQWIDPTDTTSGFERPPQGLDASGAAYVMYTSGSTGVPKGVVVEHRSVVGLVREADYVDLGPDERILHLAPGSFDASTFEIWGALLNGGSVVISPTPQPTFQQLGELIEAQSITTMWLTSTFFNAVVDAAPDILRPVRQLLVGGEALSLAHIERALELLPETTLINGYGPTETTTFACTYRLPRVLAPRSRSVPIGRPIRGTYVFLIDGNGQLAPAGAPAELYIGGRGVATGYLNRPEETARAFRTGVVPGLPGERTYRTGDIVRWRSDGTLEFLGRDDAQVKLRGFRIEPAEIETALRTHEKVHDAAVIVAGADERSHLVGFVVAPGMQDQQELHEHLRTRLPDYMIPARFVILESFPRTANGKLDRRALPVPTTEIPGRSARPATGTERRVARIFESILDVQHAYATDDFFHLGGHSLLAIRLFSEIEREFGSRLPLHLLGRAPTVRALAAEVDRDATDRVASAGVVPLRDGHGQHAAYVPFSVGGDLLYCEGLVSRLAPEVTAWGLTPPEDVNQTDLRALAGCMAERLRAHRPDGAFVLTGYSFSGMLAYEIAVELQQRGSRVALLAVIDSGPPQPQTFARTLQRPFDIARNLPNWLRDDIFASAPADVMARIRRKLRSLTTRGSGVRHDRATNMATALFEDMYGDLDVATEYRRHVEEHLQALITHVPGRFRGRLVVFRARTRPLFHSLEPDLGWHVCVDGPVEIVTLPCHHDNVLRPPHVDVIARDLSARIAALP